MGDDVSSCFGFPYTCIFKEGIIMARKKKDKAPVKLKADAVIVKQDGNVIEELDLINIEPIEKFQSRREAYLDSLQVKEKREFAEFLFERYAKGVHEHFTYPPSSLSDAVRHNIASNVLAIVLDEKGE